MFENAWREEQEMHVHHQYTLNVVSTSSTATIVHDSVIHWMLPLDFLVIRYPFKCDWRSFEMEKKYSTEWKIGVWLFVGISFEKSLQSVLLAVVYTNNSRTQTIKFKKKSTNNDQFFNVFALAFSFSWELIKTMQFRIRTSREQKTKKKKIRKNGPD